MAIINQNGTYMALPSAIKRGNPVALDTTAVWYTKSAMEEYAKNGATAYVGQILSLVDTENENAVTAYIILDEEGNLTEVGSATLGDNKTIVLNEEAGTLALKNWGVEYYKWIEPVGEEGEEDYVAGHHEKYVLTEGDSWPAGLEPKAATATDGTVVLAWYQPSTTTIEGVSSAITSVQNTVTNLTEGIGSAEDEAGANTVYGAINEVKTSNEELTENLSKKLDISGGTMTGDLILADGAKAASETVVDTKIATAVASAGHLKREIVEVLPTIEQADPDTIYMIKKSSVLLGDAYKEYMLIDGKFAQIGDTTIDLSDYVTKVEGATEGNLTSLDADGALVDSGILAQDVKNHISNNEIHITAQERIDWNAAKSTADANAEAIENLVKISQDDADKLAALPAITEIGDNLTFENGVLNVVMPDAYELPMASADTLGGIKIGTGLAIDNDGIVTVDLPMASADTNGLMSAEHFVKLTNVLENAQINVVEGMLLGNDTVATIDENKNILLPFATATPGVIVSSAEDNQISVNATTGVMNVNRIGTSKLFVDDAGLILNGGNAKE